ncbi:2578_t:CDS:2 [Entrophospora sp. SA101]|nr:2578_t:CDS:2 [Entrophospora sp. SA101]
MKLLQRTTGRSPRTVVAYGDVFFSSSSRGDPSGPKKGLFLQLKKYVGLGNMMNSKLPLSVLAVMDKWRMLASIRRGFIYLNSNNGKRHYLQDGNNNNEWSLTPSVGRWICNSRG